MTSRGAWLVLVLVLCLPTGGPFRFVLRAATTCEVAGCCCAPAEPESCGCEKAGAVPRLRSCTCNHTRPSILVVDGSHAPRLAAAADPASFSDPRLHGVLATREVEPESPALAPEPPPPRRG